MSTESAEILQIIYEKRWKLQERARKGKGRSGVSLERRAILEKTEKRSLFHVEHSGESARADRRGSEWGLMSKGRVVRTGAIRKLFHMKHSERKGCGTSGKVFRSGRREATKTTVLRKNVPRGTGKGVNGNEGYRWTEKRRRRETAQKAKVAQEERDAGRKGCRKKRALEERGAGRRAETAAKPVFAGNCFTWNNRRRKGKGFGDNLRGCGHINEKTYAKSLLMLLFGNRKTDDVLNGVTVFPFFVRNLKPRARNRVHCVLNGVGKDANVLNHPFFRR